MANDLLKNPQHKAKLSYNGFAMHQKADFTMSIGQLIPIYYDILQPGDKFKAQGFVNLRTQPLEQAAYLNAKVRLDWFVVPLEQLFKYFGDMYYNIQDFGTDHVTLSVLSTGQTDEIGLGPTNKTYFPKVTLKNYVGTYLLNKINNSIWDLQDTQSYNYAYGGIQACDTLRLMDALCYPINGIMWTTETESQNLSYSIWLALAYQKIYYDYYRLTDRQVNDPSYYNFDSFINSILVSDAKIDKFFRLRYIPYAKDFRTNTFVSPLQGAEDVGSLGSTANLFNSWLSTNVFTEATADSSSSSAGHNPTTVFANIAGFSGSSYALKGQLNPNTIRGLFATEKALEITRRAAKHYDAQTLAHWGVEPPKSIAGEVLYLGSQTQPFIIGDVVSTAASGSEPLGTIAGKGYSSGSVQGANNRPVNYDGGLNCHAVIMCLACVQPEVMYTQRGVDKLNMLITPKDFIHPEFDNMGMQPYYWYQYLFQRGSQDPVPSDIYGWQYAYSEFKMKQNRVFGGVHNDASLYAWVPQFDSDIQDSNGLPTYLVTPEYLNNVLVYPFRYNKLSDSDGAWLNDFYSRLYEHDPFICHAEFNCSKASKMSKYSLVNL